MKKMWPCTLCVCACVCALKTDASESESATVSHHFFFFFSHAVCFFSPPCHCFLFFFFPFSSWILCFCYRMYLTLTVSSPPPHHVCVLRALGASRLGHVPLSRLFIEHSGLSRGERQEIRRGTADGSERKRERKSFTQRSVKVSFSRSA